MADIAASDITVTQISKQIMKGSKRLFVHKLAFGDGALTYPAGGIPISKGALGCPNSIDSLNVFAKGTSGYAWSYDKVNEKLVAMQAPSHTHDLLLKDAAVADGATTRVNAGANLLGANTGSDITVTGGGANGGVVSVAAGVMSQPSTVAIAAQTLYVEVMGW
jgi:hypothetical protein